MNYSDDQKNENCSDNQKEEDNLVLVGVMYISYTTHITRTCNKNFSLSFFSVLQHLIDFMYFCRNKFHLLEEERNFLRSFDLCFGFDHINC